MKTKEELKKQIRQLFDDFFLEPFDHVTAQMNKADKLADEVWEAAQSARDEEINNELKTLWPEGNIKELAEAANNGNTYWQGVHDTYLKFKHFVSPASLKIEKEG